MPEAPHYTPKPCRAIETDGQVVSPLPGKVVHINIKKGELVKKGTLLVIIEAMKMENELCAPFDGIVESIIVTHGETFRMGQLIAVIGGKQA